MKQVLSTSLAILITGVLGIAGCSRPGADQKKADVKPLTGATGKPAIVVIPGTQSPEYLKLLRSGAIEAGHKFGVDIEWSPTTGKDAISEQSKKVYDVIEKKPAGIILAPLHRVRMLSPVNNSSKSQIPIVLVDNNVDTNFRLSLVGTNHEEAGVLAARYIGKAIGGAGKVGIVAVSSLEPTALRVESFEKTIAAEFPGITLVKPEWSVINNTAATSLLIGAHSDIKALYAADEDSTTEVVTALQRDGFTGKLKVVTTGAARSAVEELKRGRIDALLASNPYKMGYESVKAIVDFREFRRPPKRIDTGVALITKENLNAPENRELLAPRGIGAVSNQAPEYSGASGTGL